MGRSASDAFRALFISAGSASGFYAAADIDSLGGDADSMLARDCTDPPQMREIRSRRFIPKFPLGPLLAPGQPIDKNLDPTADEPFEEPAKPGQDDERNHCCPLDCAPEEDRRKQCSEHGHQEHG